MMKRFFLSLGAIACTIALAAIMIAPAAPALAAETTISLSTFLDPIKPLLIEIVTVVVGAIVGVIAAKVNKLTGLNIEAKHREVLHSALMNGALKGVSYVSKLSADTKIDVRSAILAEGLQYVAQAAPEAIRYFGLTPDRLREMLEAKLPAATANA